MTAMSHREKILKVVKVLGQNLEHKCKTNCNNWIPFHESVV